MRIRAFSAVTVLPALLATGCLREPDLEAYTPDWEPPAETVVQREVTLKWQHADDEAPPPAPLLAASPRDRVVPDPIPFRIGAGHGALGTIDLEPCRAKGLPSGYLAMRVTFHRNGRIAHAVVEGPVAPPDEALDCVAEQIQSATVPVFDGRDASLTKRFFVEAGDGTIEPGDTVVRKGAPARHTEGESGESAGLMRR
ncbi:MAG TPA: hypothetical protein VGL81_22185 [Polyangiaceae bacterium]|jgi:hypothetical protein